jgi:lipoprotein-anchoring transpeptidase ErfK/SrfK
MSRIFASARVPALVPAGALLLLIASDIGAASQVLDPGWQLVYSGQPEYGSDGGLIQSTFGDGTGQPVVARAYQPAPTYYQAGPQPRPYQPAPVYYRQVPAAAPLVQPPMQSYYRQAPVPQPRGYQPAAGYSQQIPVQQVPASQPAPVLRQQLPSQQPSDLGPRYTGSTPTQQPRGFFTTPGNYQVASAPPRGVFAPAAQNPQPAPPQQLAFGYEPAQPQGYNYPPPAYAPSTNGDMAQPVADPKYDRQLVDYAGDEKPGTIVIDTPHFFLYLVLDGGKALRYGIGVGRPGFTWAGVKQVSAMREWPDWYPPTEMLQRRPDLPRYMPGGPDNPLGARALYLGSTLYRIHGSNEPWSIGTQVSSGCIRLRNADIVDLYSRVKVGARVVVI